MSFDAPLNIRRATPADAPGFTRIMGHPEVLPYLMQVPYVVEERLKTLLTEQQTPGKTDLMLVAERADAHGEPAIVGTCGLHPVGLQLRRRHVMMLGLSVAPEAQGQGVGRALMTALLDYADRWAQVLRLELQVFADNQRAIALYESLGFRCEGRHIGYALRDGQYVDSLSMARLHPRPPVWPPQGA
ncbi:GNAT family N-acetyltransferase [Aquabacterium sp. OR-4]|uniref:GNAT family N-acetyltransferase n=1 Tax=Aquabacterium sp. OR-4 TaxID=2978127 RepID=UPI0021B3F88E|nr:GNAT family N-acetyltransferase [Aquabacterium sp. OR-4]MDT7834771.1 GNAT family N-acetyltransferase [Aquabacterium sp. OR-4]